MDSAAPHQSSCYTEARMARLPAIEIGTLFVATDDTRHRWQVKKFLADEVHLVLARVDEPSRLKTISRWALVNQRHFVRAASVPDRLAAALLER